MLGRKTAFSGSLMVVARLIARVMDLLTMLVLARLLSPADFGFVAIAMIVVFITEAALELPLSQALVRLPKIEDSYYDTAFTLGLLRGLVLCAIICACAVPFARFYHHPGLAPLICALSIAPAARGLLNPRMAKFAKELNFKWEFLFELSGKFCAFLLGMTIALLTRSYWAIAIGTITAPAATTILSYCLKPFRPRITLSDWRVFVDFLGWISVSQVIMAVNWQSDQLLLGKLMRPAQLGLFSTANNVANIPLLALFAPVLRPLLSAFAMVKDDPKRLQRVYREASTAIVTIGLPLMAWQSLAAGPIIRLLLGPKWVNAIPMLHWMSISLIPVFFGVPITPLGMALNQTNQLAWRNFVQFCVKIPCVVVGALMFGFAGVIGARLLSETVGSIYCMMIAQRLIDVSVISQVINCWRSIISTILMAVVLSASAPLIALGNTTAMLVSQIVLTVLIGGGVYCGCVWLLWIIAGRPSGVESTVLRLASHSWQSLRNGRLEARRS